ncbi:MAG TPA: manganese-dependent inorganic pyrophosphatase [Paracoccus sp. (in: a-proteobacteria)]|uniref:manganese-dependent inorganic pyrophosphatase n=1 Tax=uncultured Paracoccus sp. TaxID=189685 RepID=UPI00262239FE|nr:manganese-dependent inorganic pyrophosphatase [uncultured Paracoccus sp.]HMQ42461.1 manganese-dependent inorganic pyrophosphatase [Paracoccus sp. (in: a-proteobacteria)]HMR35940.1 manganese-dependent inorganic pyrophosphatase [Paracoccus sp. (in: a-proteobacteria)]
MITVLAHKSPDTDATGSPIIWAWYLNEVRKTPARAILQGKPNTEAGWMLTRWGRDMPEIVTELAAGSQTVICDTNNPAELPEGINETEVLEIIDHHMLVGGIKTRTPINITIRPLACTATIMHDLIGDDLSKAPDWVKGVMLTCILSDTLEFRSPTTTAHDKAVAEKLAADLGVNVSDYAAEMFAAKSDVSAFSDEELLRMDSKEFELDGKKLRVSVLETTAPKVLLDRKAALMAAMPGVASADGADEVLLFVVDILNEEATLLVPNDYVKQVAEASFDAKVAGDSVVLPGIMSRKKQIIPSLKL